MTIAFADTVYWIAIASPKDAWHRLYLDGVDSHRRDS